VSDVGVQLAGEQIEVVDETIRYSRFFKGAGRLKGEHITARAAGVGKPVAQQPYPRLKRRAPALRGAQKTKFDIRGRRLVNSVNRLTHGGFIQIIKHR